MDEELETPLEGYKVYYRDKFLEVANEYYDELVKKANINIEENEETIKALNDKQKEYEAAKNKLGTKKGLNTFLTILIIAGAIFTLIFINLMCTDGVQTFEWVGLIISIVAIIAGIIGKTTGLKKAIKALKELVDKLYAEMQELLNTAKAQMAPLNALFDWNIPVILTKKTIPTMQLDQYFDANKFEYLKEKYGLDHSDPRVSALYVQSGSILGNPFILCKDYVNYIYSKRYSNSITIHWTTVTHTKNGPRTVHHSQTLTASVYADAPGYYHSTYLIYGNEAAPHLKFTRMPTDVENMTDKQIEKFVKKKAKDLNKKESKALTDKDPNTNYSRFGNDEFETIFGGTDRNNEVEYNLLFTPLAQANLLNLMKDKEKIAFGDDFAFNKEGCLNLIQSEHSQKMDYRANPTIFMGYDYAAMRKKFIDFNAKWFKSLYFDLAPLLSIPLYQSYKSTEYIYKGVGANLSDYEHEVMANQFDPSLLSPKDSCTPNIYKTQFLGRRGNSDEFRITAHAFRGEKRVTVISKYGRDGRYHQIPVHWIEYFPIEKDTDMIINRNNQSRYEFNNSNHSGYSNLKTHFERGLIGFLGFDAMFSPDDVVSQAAVEEGFNLEKTIAALEEELNKQDQYDQGVQVDENRTVGEEKEVSEDEIKTGSDEDDEPDEIDEDEE